MTDERARGVHLRRGDTSLVVRLDSTELPCVLHWGPDLGETAVEHLPDLLRSLEMPSLDGAIYQHSWASVLPQQTSGWVGRPGLLGSRAGQAWALTFDSVDHTVTESTDCTRLTSVALDKPAGVEVTTEIELFGNGLLRLRASVRNLGATPYAVTLLEPALPVPAEADELLDMAGRHAHERTPQRHAFTQGQHVREAWGGRPGHDSATVLCAGRSGFGFRAGRVWGVHLGWSGNQVLCAESSFTGWKLLRGGELLMPGEMVLGHDETYASPWLYASWGEGLDAFSGRFHEHLRARVVHPRRARPVLLNTWEAVYFDMDMQKLIELAERAADLGVERYVLDDGWFKGRRAPTSSLGDWVVDEDVFPDGLTPLVKTVQGLGMEFGLWFEPEMVSLDSDVAREHPEWILGTHAGPGISSRNQHVLDLSDPDAWDHVFGQISALVDRYDIAYIKWDHNRALTGAGRGRDHRPAVHLQTLATYRLMDALRAEHPGLEIESCCGGGGRLDLGVLERTDRAWVSDCIDAHEGHRLVRWTGLTLPPELMGTHVGSSTDHTTGRRHTLRFRAGTAMWGHLGIEWDLTAMTDEEREELRAWIALHKQFRGLLHSGRVVRADTVPDGLQLDGVVAPDGREALFRLSALDLTLGQPAGRIRFPGLTPETAYRVTPVPLAVSPTHSPRPTWHDGGAVMSGRLLDEVGVVAPLLEADDLVIVHLVAEVA
ncbi:alpha-galactosidase [Nocardioides sp. YR527]|uniref:alpha-galactosidase n=1 Tax=Nocardioides sp. YR527 TaxID=1881028 RepID=UPI0008809C2E|nr:alpha-galactosidase [Nocardioides sp. YR527]SDK93925.1 alpha-galactosidase [Nocardioides sp. YR527]